MARTTGSFLQPFNEGRNEMPIPTSAEIKEKNDKAKSAGTRLVDAVAEAERLLTKFNDDFGLDEDDTRLLEDVRSFIDHWEA